MFRIKHFIQQSWLLIVSSFFFGLLIAVTNTALSGRIIQNEKDKLNNLMRNLIAAESFKPVVENVEITGPKNKILTTDIYKALDADKNIAGFAFIAAGPGWGGKIKLIIAVDGKCEKFYGFNVLSSTESPGIGSKISERFFASQFESAATNKFDLVKTGNPEMIDSRIVAISGATVSSEAVVKIFNVYIDQIKEKLRQEALISE